MTVKRNERYLDTVVQPACGKWIMMHEIDDVVYDNVNKRALICV